MTAAFRSRLAASERGATLVEFGLISIILVSTLLGFMDLGHSLYMQSVLQGTIQKTARDGTLENGSVAAQQTAMDDHVRESVKRLAANSTVDISRRFFKSFTKAAQAIAEPFQDLNTNGRCDANEPFQDNNNNSVRDIDGGDNGQGTAKDSVVYIVKVSYPRLFPIAKLVGISNTVTIEANMVLANQPFGEQGLYGTPTVGQCK